MNKLIQQLLNTNLTQAGVSTRSSKYMTFDEKFTEDRYTQTVQYDLNLKLQSRVCYNSNNPSPLVKKRAAEIIINEVFGEFRENIVAIQNALYEYDTESAIMELKKLEKRMFEV